MLSSTQVEKRLGGKRVRRILPLLSGQGRARLTGERSQRHKFSGGCTVKLFLPLVLTAGAKRASAGGSIDVWR
jgi:hypothetical protein